MASNQLKMAQTLIGKKIKVARYLMPTELEAMALEHLRDPMIIIILQDNTQMILQSDPEGNGAGRLLVVHPNDEQDLF